MILVEVMQFVVHKDRSWHCRRDVHVDCACCQVSTRVVVAHDELGDSAAVHLEHDAQWDEYGC